MATIIVAVAAAAALAFGAVYPWGYIPLFIAAAVIGCWGFLRGRGVLPHVRALAISLLLIESALGLQLIPLARSRLDAISPHAAEVLNRFSLPFRIEGSAHPLSINPSDTALAMGAAGALGLYLLGAPGALSGADIRALPRNVILVAVPLALFGIVSRERSNGLVYWFWQPRNGSGDNAFGPFINRNHFAGWMLMATCLAIGALLGQIEHARQRGERGWRNRTLWLSTPEADGILLAACGTGIMALSLVWTLSRSGIVSFCVSLACFFWLVSSRRPVTRLRRTLAIAALALILVGSLSWRGPDRLTSWFGDTRTLQGRFAAWQDGWRVVKDFPLVGTGLDTYSTVMLFYQTADPQVHMAQAHNDYLQVLAEGGLLVSTLAVAGVVCLVVAIRRNLGALRHEHRGYWIRAGAAVGLIGIGIQETVEFSLQIPANAFLFCTLAAICLSPVERRPDEVVAGSVRL